MYIIGEVMKVEITIYFRAHHLWFLKGTVSLEKDGVLSYEVRFFKMASSLHIYKTNVFAPTRKSFWNAQLSVSVQ